MHDHPLQNCSNPYNFVTRFWQEWHGPFFPVTRGCIITYWKYKDLQRTSMMAQNLKYISSKVALTGITKNSLLWGNTMKRSREKKVQDTSQSAYMKVLNSLRNSISSEYSKAIQKEKRAIILGYDWDLSEMFIFSDFIMGWRFNIDILTFIARK